MSDVIFKLEVLDHGLDTKAIEVQRIDHALKIAAQKVRSTGGHIEKGDIVGEGGVVIGSWEFTTGTE